MNETLISSATKKNWVRLGVDEKEKSLRLSKRANKRLSEKNIIPIEYFVNKKNVPYLENVLSVAREFNFDPKTVIYNLALNILSKEGLFLCEDKNFCFKKQVLVDIFSEFKLNFEKKLFELEIPTDEIDFLGIVYQSLLKEGSKNVLGSYYTPNSIIENILVDIKGNEKFLDPCCGTGSFLLSVCDKIKNPLNIYGSDMDPIACFIAKINLIIKFKDIDFYPNIYNIDFLSDNNTLVQDFDLIATNPPWGAENKKDYSKSFPQIHSKESFSYFIVKSEKMLSPNGVLAFVLPESILNVACHKDIRKFILNNFHIKEIKIYDNVFSGVLSNVILIKLDRCIENNLIKISANSDTFSLNQDFYNKNYNYNFSILSDKDSEILEHLYSTPYNTLKDSTFALGIVTGNNKKFISDSPVAGYEPVYTGKEVERYFLKPCKKFINYARDLFQQIAPDAIYRNPEKLIYKFVSSKLVFAYDDSSSLFLNSANILIPKMKGYCAKTVMAYLNSELFEYIYNKKFNELKILKNNLMQLPFPLVSQKSEEELLRLVNLYMNEKSENILEEINKFIYKSFNLSVSEIKYIKKNIK